MQDSLEKAVAAAVGLIISLVAKEFLAIAAFLFFYTFDFFCGMVDNIRFRHEKWSRDRAIDGVLKGLIFCGLIVCSIILDAIAMEKGANLHGLFSVACTTWLIGHEMWSIGKHARNCGCPVPKWWMDAARKLRAVSPDCEKVEGGE
jgi:phage-related holin